MFAQSQITRTTLIGCQYLKQSYKFSVCSETTKFFATWNNLGQLEVDEKYGNQLSKRWSSSRLSDGLSHHYYPGPKLLDITIGQLLANAVEKWPNRECIVSSHENVRITYSQLLRRADRLAAGLLQLGLKKGDRVGVWGPNQVEWIISFMAVIRAGLITVAINPAYQQSEIDYCLQKVQASAVIAPMQFKNQNYSTMMLRAKNKCPSLKHIIIYSEDSTTGTYRLADVEALPNNAQVEAITAMQSEISPHDGCNIQFTSGTTGNPKAALLCHKSFVNNSRQTAERSGLMKGEHKICLNVPLFHAFGLVMGQFTSLHTGATIVLEAPSYNPKNSVESILKYKCTACYGTPTMWINLLDARCRLEAPIKTLQMGVTGGAPMSPYLMNRIRQELRFDRMQNIYGMTETTAVTFQSLPGESYELSDNAVGHLSDNVEVMVVDENGSPVPVESPGELWVRGYSLMMRYWNDEENTKKTITEDGWLKTGDQFLMHSNGYGQVVGRLKDMIIRGGENIFPREIEHFLETHPDVLEAIVIGVHDDVYGEEICACIRLAEGTTANAKNLQDFGKGKIAHFKIPRYIEFFENYPRTTSGKIQKYKLLEDLETRGVVPVKPSNKR